MTLTTSPASLSEDQALYLLEKVVKQSEADEVFVSLSTGEESLSRFSENQISQNISKTVFSLNVTSYFGNKSASAAVTDFDEDAIAQTVKRSQELAQIAPADPEWMPLLPPQTYDLPPAAFDEATAAASPLARAEMVQQACAIASQAGANASGTLSTEASLYAIASSTGLRACNHSTEANLGFTTRIDNGSSWTERTAWSISQLPIAQLAQEVVDRALASRNPRPITPGVYPVIFDGAAFADLLPWVIWGMDARAADEGRSFMSIADETGKPLGNRAGQQLFSPLVQVQRDPAHPLLRSGNFFGDGLSNNYLEIIKNGIPQGLSYSRYWAAQKGKESKGAYYPIVMTGSDQSLADLIAQTERGIFVSRAWYVNYVNPKTSEVTGMTRDGTFWIENGKIAYPIKNLRFNQVLPHMLRDVDSLSEVKRYGGSVVPAVRVKAFNFTSITDSL
ncbi:TldD/PmbA family protein [Microcoleus sp. LEGE 07076]|uniref:TldD/PmbA family protein n=1 Tax=Microcoleus sp. LEGE 07076 TaxID=915322 RepID=UPI0018808381|nr:TldD/PmbA family protein [Microcoleus sp. LEGE 07076]MBE9187462.1 TldD/PmbA family protein [Microcoleus sp. LEGE 07076]